MTAAGVATARSGTAVALDRAERRAAALVQLEGVRAARRRLGSRSARGVREASVHLRTVRGC